MGMKVEIRCFSRQSAQAVACDLIDQGTYFHCAVMGGRVPVLFTIENPTEEQLMYLSYHYKIDIKETTREYGTSRIVEDDE